MVRGKHHRSPPEPEGSEVEALRKNILGLEEELNKQKNQSEEYRGLLQRLQADFENHIKRSEIDRREFQKTASQGLVEKLVDVLDTMEIALKASSKDSAGEKMLDGFRRVYKQLDLILKAEGLEEVSNEGLFNLDVHEVVETLSDGSKHDGEIVDVVQKGYRLNGKLIRASKVIIIKNNGECDGKNNRD
ncbi:MAG: nucleotide exchange factor GrpE [Candidatus Altiarchaeota archaeon]|nr:nucleotide exchange factor GrpE [Candidatus Altiarchaeota archaeon]